MALAGHYLKDLCFHLSQILRHILPVVSMQKTEVRH